MGGVKEEAPKDEMMAFPLKKLLTMKSDKKAQKKTTTFNLDQKEEEVQPPPPLLPYVLPENFSEIIYADLMSKLLIFDSNIQGVPGMWRSEIKYLNNLCKAIHLFNLPEF